MAVPFSNTKLRVPHGFQALLEGMAREILQAQPTDIYACSAMYFENLLKLREGGSVDPNTRLSQIEDRMYNNKAFKTPEDFQSMEEERDAAVVIQTKFRQYEAKSQADDIRQQNAAVKIQAGIRGYLTRKQLKALQTSKPAVAAAVPDDDEDEELRDFQGGEALPSSRSQGNEQNVYSQLQLSGFLHAEPAGEDEASADAPPADDDDKDELPDSERIDAGAINDEEQEHVVDFDHRAADAATKIQAGFRGMRTRAEIKDLKDARAEEVPVVVDDDHEVDDEEVGGLPDETADAEADAEPKEDAGPADDVPMSSARDDGEDAGDETATAPGEVATDEHHPVDGDEDQAALSDAVSKIQAGFRGMKTRRETQMLNDARREEEVAAAETVGAAEVTLEAAEEAAAEQNADDATDDQESTSRAATKIQAGFRGMKTRAELQVLKETRAQPAEDADAAAAVDESVAPTTEVDANRDEISDATAKIQAGFRGMQSRREMALLTKAEDADGLPEVGVPDDVAEGELNDNKTPIEVHEHDSAANDAPADDAEADVTAAFDAHADDIAVLSAAIDAPADDAEADVTAAFDAHADDIAVSSAAFDAAVDDSAVFDAQADDSATTAFDAAAAADDSAAFDAQADDALATGRENVADPAADVDDAAADAEVSARQSVDAGEEVVPGDEATEEGQGED